MLEFICLGSGSSGNAYLIKKEKECVLLECGFEFRKLIAKLMENNIDLSQIKSVIVSHKHGDHAKSLKNFIENGMTVYAPASALSENERLLPNVNVIESKSKFELAEWLKVICFETLHDVECYGFIFMEKESKETVLFLTDTKLFDFPYWDYTFDYIFIECNHIRKQLEVVMQRALDNHKEGEVYKFKRQSAYHLSLASTKKFLSKLDVSNTKAIFLIHLSKDLCNDIMIKTEISSVYKRPTFVCYASGGIN